MMDEADHRPWPRPRRPWVMAQAWHHLLFAHWPVPAAALRPLVPPALELETFDGSAWVGVIPFTMTGIRLRRLPPIPGLSAFEEVNVRTYVTSGGKAGVWFLSLDASSALNAWAARRWFHLPYLRARMSIDREGEAICYTSRRADPRGAPAELRVRYGPAGEPARPSRGSLDEWLMERYCLYSQDRRARVLRAEIDHPPWSLQAAWADIEANTMALAQGVTLPGTRPLLHFARRQDAVVWGPEGLGG